MKDYIFTFCIRRPSEGYSNIKIIASAENAEDAYTKAEDKARKVQGPESENDPVFIEVEVLGLESKKTIVVKEGKND